MRLPRWWALPVVARCASAFTDGFFGYKDAFTVMGKDLLSVLEQPWPYVELMAEWFDTGSIDDVHDEGGLNFAARLIFQKMRILAHEPSMTMLYVGFEDGTFVGYYGADANGGAIPKTLLDAPRCPWTYDAQCGGGPADYCADGYGSAPACREYFETDGLTGEPTGDPFKTVVYDPRARGWYQAAMAHHASASAATNSWSDLYVFASTGVIGVTATRAFNRGPGGDAYGVVGMDFAMSDLEAILGGVGGVTWVVDAADGSVIASSLGILPTTRVEEANSTLVRAAVKALPAMAWEDGIFTFEGVDYWIFFSQLRDDFGLRWNLTAVHEVACAEGYGIDGLRRDAGAVLCQPCDRDRGVTSRNGSADCDICVAGNFDARAFRAGGDADCASCPDHFSCGSEGLTLATLPLNAGYMRTTPLSTEAVACVGGSDGASCPSDPDRVSCAGSSHASGPTCGTCDDGYFLDESAGRCVGCGNMTASSPTYILKVSFVVLEILVLGYLLKRSIGGSSDAKKNVASMNKMSRLQQKLRSKWKICYVAFSIMYSMPSILPDVKYPTMIASVMDVFGALNFDLLAPLPLACFLKTGHHAFFKRLLSTTLGPVAVIVAAVAVSEAKATVALLTARRDAVQVEDDTVERPRARASPWTRPVHTLTSVALLVSYLVVPAVTTCIFQTFVCEGYDRESGGALGDRRRYLVADLTVDCGSPSYRAHRVYAMLMVAAWPLGAPLSYFLLLYAQRHRIDPPVDGAPARMKTDGGEERVARALAIRDLDGGIRHLNLLYGPYETEFWYWEVLELIRRICATSVVMVIEGGEVPKLFYCILLSIASLEVYGVCEPFISDSDDLLAEALQLITLLSFLATLGSAVGMAGTLDQLMLALQVFALVASAALVYTDIHRERAALAYMAEEAEKQMREYGVDLRHSADLMHYAPKANSKRASLGQVSDAVASGLGSLVGYGVGGGRGSDAGPGDWDDDNGSAHSWDSAEDRDDFSVGSASDIAALCVAPPPPPRERPSVVSETEVL